MNNQTPTAQSGPSAENMAAIGTAFMEQLKKSCPYYQWKVGPEEIIERLIEERLEEFYKSHKKSTRIAELELAAMRSEPPAGARDAVPDAYERGGRLMRTLMEAEKTQFYGDGPIFPLYRHPPIAALTGKADGGCKLGCADQCKAELHGVPSECPDLSKRPAAQPAATGAGVVRWRSPQGMIVTETDIRLDGIDTTGWTRLETNTAATGMGDANLRALSNLAAPGLFEHDAEHASVIGGGAAPGCDGDKCVHHTIVIEDADLQFMVAAANHVRTALAAQPAPVDDDWHLRGYAYASKQATNCAQCGEHKHTPLRVDAMGGYVCLTCIDKKLGELLEAQPAPVGIECYVSDMTTSAGMEYFVCFRRNGKIITPHRFLVRGKAEYEVAEYNHFFNDGPEPDILAYDTEEPAQPAPVVGGDAEPWGYADPKSGRSIHRNLITSTVKVGALGEVGEMVDASTIYTVPLYTHPAPLLAARPGGEGELDLMGWKGVDSAVVARAFDALRGCLGYFEARENIGDEPNDETHYAAGIRSVFRDAAIPAIGGGRGVEPVGEMRMSRPSAELRWGDYQPELYVYWSGKKPPEGTKLYAHPAQAGGGRE